MEIGFQVLTAFNHDDCLLLGCDPLKSSSDEPTLSACCPEHGTSTFLQATVCLMLEDISSVTYATYIYICHAVL
jgi:hypothetical protein